MSDAKVARVHAAPSGPGRPSAHHRRRVSELATLADIGRSIVQAPLDQDALCELIYELAGRIVPTDTFQVGLFDGDHYRIKVWLKQGQRQPRATFPLAAGEGIIGWLAAEHQPLLVRDFQQEMDALPARPVYLSDDPPRSGIYLPLLIGDEAIGALSIQSPAPDAFDEHHLRLLTILANQSASALRNAQLFDHAERRLNALAAVSEVGRSLTRILDLDELLVQIVELMRARFGYYHVQIFLIEAGSQHAAFAASSGQGLNQKWRKEARTMRIGREGIIGWVAAHAEPLLANDVGVEPRYIPDDPRLLPDTRAELAVPMLVDGEIVGVLDVQSDQLDAFGHDDIFVIRTMADQAAVAVNAARAYEAQRVEAWVTTVMLQVAEATSQVDNVQDVLDAAVRVTAMLAGVESVVIWLWDEEHQAFEVGSSFGLAGAVDGDLPVALRVRPEEWRAFETLRSTRAPVFVNGASAADTEDTGPNVALFGDVEAVALLPMLNKGEVFGVLGAGFAGGRGNHMDDRRLAMLAGIAHQIAAAVDNSRLSAMREEEAWTSTVLLQVAEAIRRLQPVDVTLEQVTRLAPALTGVDRCVALLIDDEGNFRARTVQGQRPGLAEAYRDAVIRPGELPLLDDACRSGQPIFVDDVEGSARVPRSWRTRFGSRTILVVPLLVADEPIGALLADDVDSAHMFSPRRVRILVGIANQAAIAIENARLQLQEAERARLGRELELAQEIQRTLLPQAAPDVPGYQVAYRWRSARQVGGDFFDFMRLDPSRIGLVIADVSDKGIPAALYMMFARTIMRAVALSGRDPAQALQRANQLILSDSTSDMFVTAHYGVLHADSHRLVYSSAGHNLALHVRAAGGHIEELTASGLALGIVDDVQFEQKTIDLAEGDVILFYTDGAIDTLDPGGAEFGSDRLAALLSEHRSRSAEAIAAAIDEGVSAWAAGEPQFDDFTLIVVKRDATNDVAPE